jgi:zinc transport system substrate-binding protein
VLTANVVGDIEGVDVELVLPPSSGCPHDVSLTPGEVEKLTTAEILVVNGMGIDDALVQRARQGNPGVVVIEASGRIPHLQDSGEAEKMAGVEHGDAHDLNPHTWVSLSNAVVMVRQIAAGLSVVDSIHAAEYQRNAEIHGERLRALREEFVSLLEGTTNRRIVTFHDAFDYFAQDLKLEVAAVIEEDPGQEPSAGRLSRLAKVVKAARPLGIFAEPQYSPRIAEVLSQESGVPVYTLDPVASGEPKRDAYEKAMRRNLATLKEALARAGGR